MDREKPRAPSELLREAMAHDRKVVNNGRGFQVEMTKRARRIIKRIHAAARQTDREAVEARCPIRGYLAVDVVTGRLYEDTCIWWHAMEADVADVLCTVVSRRGHLVHLEAKDDLVAEEHKGAVYFLFLLDRNTQGFTGDSVKLPDAVKFCGKADHEGQQRKHGNFGPRRP